MLTIDTHLAIPDSEIDISAIRAQGPGGQNVNKVASAVHLRFDIANSPSLSDAMKARLLALRDRRVSGAGIVVIKSSRFRQQERNRQDARERLADLIRKGLHEPPARKKTRPSRHAREKRLTDKAKRSKIKSLRRSSPDS